MLARTLGPKGVDCDWALKGWIVMSHISWRGEQTIVSWRGEQRIIYKGVETKESPKKKSQERQYRLGDLSSYTRFQN